jgi:hypothetical protein
MSFVESDDSERMLRAHERYKARWAAVHGDPSGPRRGSTKEYDYQLFGDFVNVDTLNRFNVECVGSFMELYTKQMQSLEEDEVDASVALEVLVPVMVGLFEHSWLLGYLYRDEQERDNKQKLILP